MTKREEKANAMMQEIAKEIKEKLPEGMGFALLTRAEHMKLHKINYEDKSTMLLSYMDKTIMKGEDDLS